MPSSALPIDLERELFDIAALSRPLGIPKLMLVAWRVKTWVEPLLYRTIVVWRSGPYAPPPPAIAGHPLFYRKTLLPIVESKGRSFFKDSVRHFFVDQIFEDDTEIQSILSVCTGIENLWIFEILPHLLPLVDDLPLERLHCGFFNLLAFKQLDFTHRLFSRLTHYEVIDYPSEEDFEVWRGLALIPNLTHLAFNGLSCIFLLPFLLEECRSLLLLVVLYGDSGGAERVADHVDGHKLLRDPRFVVMKCEEYEKDWQMGAATGADYWSRAEAFVALRRSGEIDPLDCEIREDASLSIL
ncbi:hypothetical protein DFH06DRAFT_1468610 [Mycena polygramma]|nr:hypothetical protein DFH06DRAFT_1468610 [Mycena polygramma]